MILNNRIRRTHVGLSEEGINIEYCINIDSDTAVLICPGDPNWGSTLNSPHIIENLFFSLDNAKISCARFTFAKYQIFNNIYDKYISQAGLALEEFLQEIGFYKNVWIAGFSFGALIALNVFLRRPGLSGFILISPALFNYDFTSWLTNRRANGLLVYGTKDQMVQQKSVVDSYIEGLKVKGMNVTLNQIIGADHSLTNKESYTSSLIINYLKQFNSKELDQQSI